MEKFQISSNLQFEIIKFEEGGRNIVVSRRKILEAEAEEKPKRRRRRGRRRGANANNAENAEKSETGDDTADAAPRLGAA